MVLQCGAERSMALNSLDKWLFMGSLIGLSQESNEHTKRLSEIFGNDEVRIKLPYAIRHLSTADCEDARDKVFGLMGCVAEDGRIPIDYSLSTEDVFWEIARTLVKKHWVCPPKRAIYKHLQQTNTHRTDHPTPFLILRRSMGLEISIRDDTLQERLEAWLCEYHYSRREDDILTELQDKWRPGNPVHMYSNYTHEAILEHFVEKHQEWVLTLEHVGSDSAGRNWATLNRKEQPDDLIAGDNT